MLTLTVVRAIRMLSADSDVARCLSVCLSHVETVKHRLLFHDRVATTPVFPYQTLWHYSDEDGLPGASNAGEKIAIFDQYLALRYLGNDKDRP